jgi:poly-gamma-glutamate capsule biosynthesis protein CapA/YwtB (metallophosphatase superfamily)
MPVQALESAFTALPNHARTLEVYAPDPVAQAIAAPLFASTAAANTAPDVAVRVLGLASTPERKAALLSINNAPAEWVDLGAARAGVTVRELDASKVTLETPGGVRDLALGETSTPNPAPTAGTAPSPAPGGYRMPPPPASAPGVR